MNFYMPTHLFCGRGVVAKHAEELTKLGESCLIVTGKHSALASGALADTQEVLEAGGVRSTIWDNVTENPLVSSCAEAGRVAAEQKAAFIIGIGGGSALDAAKAVSVFAANPALSEEAFYAKKWDRTPLPLVLIGTTAGTGSEVTKVSVLTDSAGRKHSIHDNYLYAKLSLGDACYTQTCSLSTSLSCGVDVLAHATEGYFSRKADDIARAFAVRAVRMLVEPLLTAASGATLTEEQHTQLYDASLLAGLTINTTGTCFPHNVGYYLTETYHVPHGFACAVFLPAFYSCVRNADPAYADRFYEEVGTTEDTLVQLINTCLPRLDLPMTQEEIKRALPRWENNASVQNTRADITVSDIKDILEGLFL